jgi:hypothetical protein
MESTYDPFTLTRTMGQMSIRPIKLELLLEVIFAVVSITLNYCRF